MFLYLSFESAIRFLVGFLRADGGELVANFVIGISYYQLYSLLFFIFSFGGLLYVTFFREGGERL